MPDQDNLQPTSASDWGKATANDGFVTTLPSGHVARVRRTLDLPILIKSGQIANPLKSILKKMMDSGGGGNIMEEVQADASGKSSEQLLDLLNDTTVRVMVEPRVSQPPRQERGEDWDAYTDRIAGWDPDPGTVSVFKIDMPDKMFLFAVAQGMAADLEMFRHQSSAVVDALQGSEGLVSQALAPVGAGTGERAKPAPTKRTGGGARKATAKAK